MNNWKAIFEVDNSSELSSDDLRGILDHYYEIDLGNCLMSHDNWINEIIRFVTVDGYLDDFLDQYNRYLSEREEEEVVDEKKIEKKKAIEIDLRFLFHRLGIDNPHNFDEILDHVFDDIDQCADMENWHSGDVDIAFRRWIEAQATEQP